jgi:hypothetical protein
MVSCNVGASLFRCALLGPLAIVNACMRGLLEVQVGPFFLIRAFAQLVHSVAPRLACRIFSAACLMPRELCITMSRLVLHTRRASALHQTKFPDAHLPAPQVLAPC